MERRYLCFDVRELFDQAFPHHRVPFPGHFGHLGHLLRLVAVGLGEVLRHVSLQTWIKATLTYKKTV